MAADHGVALLIDRPGAQKRVRGTDQRLNYQELAVAQHGMQSGEPGVGAQYEQAVELGILCHPRLGGREVATSR